ncbi:16S rRNA (cytosine(967)-C(5))-methyltransferase RsmB [Alishewanella longhuensis]
MSAQLRALAAETCFQVVDQGKSLSDVLPKAQQKLSSAPDKALLQEICFGVMRTLPQLETVCQQLMSKPLIKQLRPLQFLIYVGIYQLQFMRIPDHAAISETVEAARSLKGQSLTKLINGVLRNVQRQPALFDFSAASDAVKFNHPGWIIAALQQAYPEQWQEVLSANQQKAPLWLRVNQQQISPEVFVAELAQAEIACNQPLSYLPVAVKLEQARDVTALPGYEAGWFSVQDGAAQHAALLLNAQPGDTVLDACCAPGGKTCHILEQTSAITLTALDRDAKRLERVYHNLERLKLTARVVAADILDTDSWWQGELFDRILLDVPCSATGVIRRHPDIRWLRKKSDIAPLVALQQQILQQAWQLLKPGGTLLYATCSILPAENSEQISSFLAQQGDAELLPIAVAGNATTWQILPGEQDLDGFFFALLHKKTMA